MAESVKELITEYCEITGRPAATISATEFLDFKAFALKSVEQKVIVQRNEPEPKEPDSEAFKKQAEKAAIGSEKKKPRQEPVQSPLMLMRSIGS